MFTSWFQIPFSNKQNQGSLKQCTDFRPGPGNIEEGEPGESSSARNQESAQQTYTHTHTPGYSKGSKAHRSMLKELPWPKSDNLSNKRRKVVLGYNLKYKISMSLYWQMI